MSSYLFFVGNMLLPIAPERVDQHYRSSTRTTMTVEKGEYVLLNAKGLLEISFSIIIPQSDIWKASNTIFSFENTSVVLDQLSRSPTLYLDRLISYKNSSKPFQFTMVPPKDQFLQLYHSLCLKCVIDSLNIHYGERGNHVIIVDIVLLEYVPIQLKTYNSSELQNTNILNRRTLTTNIQQFFREPTVWYNSLNTNSLMNSGVQFLKNQASNLLSKATNYVDNKVLSFLPEPIKNTVKSAGWFALKSAVSFACPILGGLL